MLKQGEKVELFRTYARSFHWSFVVSSYARNVTIKPKTPEQLQKMYEIGNLLELDLELDDTELRRVQLLGYENSEKELLYRYLLVKGYDVDFTYNPQNNSYYLIIYLEDDNEFKKVNRLIDCFEVSGEFLLFETKRKKESVEENMKYQEFIGRIKHLEGVDEVVKQNNREIEVFLLSNQVKREVFQLQKEYENDRRVKPVHIQYNMSRVKALNEEEFFEKVRAFSQFVRKYHGYVEVENQTKLLAYYPSEKIKTIFESKFKDYWYTKLDRGDGRTETLSLTLIPIYPNGTAWTLDEWQQVIENIYAKLSPFGLTFDRPSIHVLEIFAKSEKDIQYNKWVFKYANKKLLLETGEVIKTTIELKRE
jgi:hypothetical protein